MVYRAPCFFGLDAWIFKIKYYFCNAITEVAQSVEHWSPKPGVGSSSLSFRAKKKVASSKRPFLCMFAFLALACCLPMAHTTIRKTIIH